jgi:diguanylate cyclase (GGDEF)-like protein
MTAERGPESRWRAEMARLRQGCALDEPYRHQQGALIRRRMQPLALLVALLAIAWIPLDAIGLQPREFQSIAVYRLLLGVALCALALNVRRLPPLPALAGFIALQCVGFSAMQVSLDSSQGGMLRLGYGLFPFVVAVELAIIPLSWACALRLALPIALLVGAPLLANAPGGGPAFWNTLWLLALLLSLSAWASNAQLSLMREMLLAQRDASHDTLTGLLNRRAATARLARERDRSLRQLSTLSVLMLDIDHFKRINDQYGHAAGDSVLLSVADVLRHELRAGDMGVRHGGEDFLVVLTDTPAASAFDAAERIRGEIARLTLTLEGHVETITVSIGIATFANNETVDQLVARADAALYRAKQAGRNRCIASEAAGSAEFARLDPNQRAQAAPARG